jgi:hypothetical protein
MSSGRYNADDAATQGSANDATEATPAPENLSSGVVSCSIERGAIEQVYPSHPRTFRQRLFAVLFAQRLPNSIYLGQPDLSLKWMSRKHVLRLSRQLRVRAHAGITSLDLSYQALGASGMRMLARSIARLTGLEDLDLSCACACHLVSIVVAVAFFSVLSVQDFELHTHIFRVTMPSAV